ncbi:MAG: flavodoxin family protein [Planctomycetota bacterium]
MAQILAIGASARRGGNSDTILDTALEVFRERGDDIEMLYPKKLAMSPCLSCNACFKTGRCVQDDELTDLYTLFCDVDHIVVATPVYFTSVPGHFKVMIDRFQCFWARSYVLKAPPQPRRQGMLMVIGAMERKRYYDYTSTVVRTWMASLNMGCPVERYYMDLDARDDIDHHHEYLDDARAAAREFVDTTEDRD